VPSVINCLACLTGVFVGLIVGFALAARKESLLAAVGDGQEKSAETLRVATVAASQPTSSTTPV
jgi:hypothetical protein